MTQSCHRVIFLRAKKKNQNEFFKLLYKEMLLWHFCIYSIPAVRKDFSFRFKLSNVYHTANLWNIRNSVFPGAVCLFTCSILHVKLIVKQAQMGSG